MLRSQTFATPPGATLTHRTHAGGSNPRADLGPVALYARPTSIPPQRDSRAPQLSSLSQVRQSAASTTLGSQSYREPRSPATSNDSADREASPTPSNQSSHKAHTASYTWPRFQPVSDRSTSASPVLFVEYRNNSPSPVLSSAPAPSRSRELPQSSRSPPLRTERTTARIESSSPYPSLSAVTAPARSSHESLREYARPPARRQPSADYIACATVTSSRKFSPSGEPNDRDLQHTFRKLEVSVRGGRSRRRHAGSPPYPYSSESESSSGRSVGVQGSIGATRHSSLDPDGEEWMRHAQALDGGGSSALYCCTWVDPKEKCVYTAKKHLVKRHIESKHLHIKPITCEICGKGFSQRTNYSTHMNTHTGDTPHKCPYANCDATFGDPARRHRHMKAVHNHIPSKRKTQSELASKLMDMEMSEPEEEESS